MTTNYCVHLLVIHRLHNMNIPFVRLYFSLCRRVFRPMSGAKSSTYRIQQRKSLEDSWLLKPGYFRQVTMQIDSGVEMTLAKTYVGCGMYCFLTFPLRRSQLRTLRRLCLLDTYVPHQLNMLQKSRFDTLELIITGFNTVVPYSLLLPKPLSFIIFSPSVCLPLHCYQNDMGTSNTNCKDRLLPRYTTKKLRHWCDDFFGFRTSSDPSFKTMHVSGLNWWPAMQTIFFWKSHLFASSCSSR